VHDREEVNASATQARINVFFFSPHRDEGGDEAMSHDALLRVPPPIAVFHATNVMLDPFDCSAHSTSYDTASGWWGRLLLLVALEELAAA
jgi:hypothetical protein